MKANREDIYNDNFLKKVLHFAWLVQFNCIECIQAIYTFFILDVEKGKKLYRMLSL